MYSSALDYWYKKRHESSVRKEFSTSEKKEYSSKQLKFGMRTYLFVGIGLGIWMGYLIWR